MSRVPVDQKYEFDQTYETNSITHVLLLLINMNLYEIGIGAGTCAQAEMS